MEDEHEWELVPKFTTIVAWSNAHWGTWHSSIVVGKSVGGFVVRCRKCDFAFHQPFRMFFPDETVKLNRDLEPGHETVQKVAESFVGRAEAQDPKDRFPVWESCSFTKMNGRVKKIHSD